jgi:hypothetical protein
MAKKIKVKGVEIDVRGKNKNKAVYVTIGDWVIYLDNSTNEKIINSWNKGDQS